MDILIIEPYFTGSHASWAEGYRAASRHNVEILALDGRSWKWRMHGGAVTLGRRFMEEGRAPDLILATDMLDLTTFLSLTRTRTAGIPTAVYFHENQFTYPWSPGDRDVLRGRDLHYGFINYASALAADRVFFNSRYHMDSFFAALEGYLKGLPDNNELSTIEIIKKKSQVLYLGMDLVRLKAAAPASAPAASGPALILWNHRWEYDKNPGEFFEALYALEERSMDFEVAILGEDFSKRPKEFEAARVRLGPKVVHFGFVEDLASYASWLKRADILPVTSKHDFFGCSVIEALYMGCIPILPNRLAYPEHIPEDQHHLYLYDDFKGLVAKLARAVSDIATVRATDLGGLAAGYDWGELAPVYDEEMERMAGAPASSGPSV
jgi:glycosyltransferase involved in cell wall biosynthesis